MVKKKVDGSFETSELTCSLFSYTLASCYEKVSRQDAGFLDSL